ncbi:MAG: glycosyltransferase, partial [Nitrososphaerota archaeon]|nr:glycosyltransferase [Nitrososphaerota archaeon]
YPVRGLLNQKYTGLYGLYFMGYKYLQGREGFEKRYLDRTRIITNSKFTQSEIRRILGRDSEVVYPPAVSADLTDPKFPRRDQVLTVSRIALDKDLGILKDIASKNTAFRYYLVGTTDKTSPQVVRDLRGVTFFSNVRYDVYTEVIKDIQGIIIFPNLGYSDLKELYSTSKVYLHTKHNEHFGISIVEAMAHGCVPVVHKSGGPWIDILDQKQGEYGYAYETAEEAYRYIEFLMVDRGVREEISRRARERALSLFSEEAFQRRMVEIVESTLSRVAVVQ